MLLEHPLIARTQNIWDGGSIGFGGDSIIWRYLIQKYLENGQYYKINGSLHGVDYYTTRHQESLWVFRFGTAHGVSVVFRDSNNVHDIYTLNKRDRIRKLSTNFTGYIIKTHVQIPYTIKVKKQHDSYDSFDY